MKDAAHRDGAVFSKRSVRLWVLTTCCTCGWTSSTALHSKSFQDWLDWSRSGLSKILVASDSLRFENLYVDGGNTIQRFLEVDLIDELIITELPILLGGGDRLFGMPDQEMRFELVGSEVLL